MTGVEGLVEAGALWSELDRVVFDEETICHRVRELGAEISRDYMGRDLMVVGILKGAAPFASDLIRRITAPLRLDFISVTSYEPHPRPGVVRILKDLAEDVAGSHLLVVEDIVDTGLTLNYLLNLLRAREPASLQVCTLLDRPELRLVDIPMRYVGFQVTDEFLVGYGLDHREQFRNLPFVATLRGGVPGRTPRKGGIQT